MSLNRSQCYKLLGLDERASINQIKDAYRKLALEYHPDKNISAKDGEKFKMISEAYHILREKNNLHFKTDHRAQGYQKNHQYEKNVFLSCMNLFYMEMHHIYIKYVKNALHNYIKYEPVFFAYWDKTSRNISVSFHRIIRLLPYNHTKNLVFNYIKMTKNLLTRI